MSFETALQTAIFTRLDGQLSTPVYDNVPQQADTATGFPYVTVGDDTINEWDTDGFLGADCTIQVHVWSRKDGRKETKEIQGNIYNALHRKESTLSAVGYRFVGIDFVSSDSFLDADGETRHGVQTFRVIIEEI